MRISDWSSDVCSSDLIDKPSSNCLVVIELRGDRACGIDQARRGVGRLVRIVEHGRILSFGPLWSGKSPPSLSPPKMAQAQRGRLLRFKFLRLGHTNWLRLSALHSLYMRAWGGLDRKSVVWG